MSLNITDQGKLALQTLVTSLHLRPGSVIIVKTNDNEGRIVEQLMYMTLPVFFSIPIIVIKPEDDISTIDRKELEEALAILDRK